MPGTWADKDYPAGTFRRLSLKIVNHPGIAPYDIVSLANLSGIAVTMEKSEMSVEKYDITNMSDVTPQSVDRIFESRYVTLLIRYPIDPYAYPKLVSLAENECCFLLDERLEHGFSMVDPFNDYNTSQSMNKKDTYELKPVPKAEQEPPQRILYVVSYYQIPNGSLEAFYNALGHSQNVRAHVVIDSRSEDTHVYFKILSDVPDQVSGFSRYIYSSETIYRDPKESLSSLISRFHRKQKLPAPAHETKTEPKERRVRLV